MRTALAALLCVVAAPIVHAEWIIYSMDARRDRVCLQRLDIHEYPFTLAGGVPYPGSHRWAELDVFGCWPTSETRRLRKCVAAKNADPLAVLTAITCAEMDGALPNSTRHVTIKRYEYGKSLAEQIREAK